MAATDRAFRALGRDEPATLLALINLLLPDLLPDGLSLRNLSIRDPRLDMPDPSIEADAVFLQEERGQLWHLEGQGYDEEGFLDRVLRYHLGFVLRYWDREVRSLILWMRPPSQEQRLPLLRKGALSVVVHHVVLREASARVLVQHDTTACFAPAADDEGRGHDVVCQQAVAVLRESGASLRRWQMAAVAARSHSKERYHAMVRAMEYAGVRSVIIEDLLKIGEEFGIEKGLQQGIERGIEKGLQQGIERGIEKGLQQGIERGIEKGLQQGIERGIEKGLQQGIERGIEKGLQQGIERGIEEGRLKEVQHNTIRLLEGRGLALSETQRARILACNELDVLERWFQQAITAGSTDEALR